MNLLKMSPVQKIMVTHSPTIAGSFEPDEIVVLHEDGSVTQPESGFLSGDAGVVARWWVGRQLEPLTAGTVIAVEGASDRIIVNRVAAVLKLDLDWYDVVVAETGGCGDMWVVEAIFGSGGFDIPLFELVDDDNRQVIANRVGADPDDPEDLAKHDVFVSDKDLEDEYIRAIGVPAFWSRIKASGAFSRRELRQCRAGRDGNPTAADLAELARRKKVPAAFVAASLLDEKNAPLVQSVVRLLSAPAPCNMKPTCLRVDPSAPDNRVVFGAASGAGAGEGCAALRARARVVAVVRAPRGARDDRRFARARGFAAGPVRYRAARRVVGRHRVQPRA